ncbi:unnamed protein product, partial [Prorocentrum cordatum]
MTAVIQNTVKGLQTQLEARFLSVETNVTTLTQHMGNAKAHITAINNQMTEVMKMQSHSDSLKAQYPDLLANVEAKFFAIAQSYSIIFQNKDDASQFQREANRAGVVWTDPRSQLPHQLRVRADLPQPVRNKKRAFHKLWLPVRDLLQQSYMWSPDCQLGIDGFRGVMRVKNDLDVWNLIEIKQVRIRNGEEQFTFEPNFEEVEEWGITRGTIMALIESQ